MTTLHSDKLNVSVSRDGVEVVVRQNGGVVFRGTEMFLARQLALLCFACMVEA